jgi:hypothetical protein
MCPTFGSVFFLFQISHQICQNRQVHAVDGRRPAHPRDRARGRTTARGPGRAIGCARPRGPGLGLGLGQCPGVGGRCRPRRVMPSRARYVSIILGTTVIVRCQTLYNVADHAVSILDPTVHHQKQAYAHGGF